MSKTIVGLFENYNYAKEVARELEVQGFSRSDISVVASNHTGEHSAEVNDVTDEESPVVTSAGTGAAIGGAAGIALGLVALAIPGIGPVIALGPLATALTGAGLGALAGGLIGAMTNLGIPEDEAHYYSGHVKEGRALVVVHSSEERAQTAVSILEQLGASDLRKQDDNTQTMSSGVRTYAANVQR